MSAEIAMYAFGTLHVVVYAWAFLSGSPVNEDDSAWEQAL